MGMTVRDTTMLYLSQMMGKPVVDTQGEKIGTISDLAISTGEVFPRITSLAFQGPGKVPFMISWRKYVDTFDEDGITLNAEAHDIRFSYLQPDEVLLARDLLNRQIVDTQGLKVVRVNDLKLSVSGSQLRLLGAEVGVRGILRGLASWLERAVVAVAKVFGKKIDEQIIAWNYMDLLDRDLSEVQLSVTHKRLDELHPADVADILEQLDPQQRANVFQHLDDAQATEAISEMDDEYQADFIEDLDDARAAGLLGDMDPDDAADIVRDVMFDDVISATPDETEEDVAADIFKYELPAMPVVDEHGVLLGIVTVDDAWDAIEEDVSGDKTKATLLKVLGGLVASILFLALYTLVLLQIIGYAGR